MIITGLDSIIKTAKAVEAPPDNADRATLLTALATYAPLTDWAIFIADDWDGTTNPWPNAGGLGGDVVVKQLVENPKGTLLGTTKDSVEPTGVLGSGFESIAAEPRFESAPLSTFFVAVVDPNNIGARTVIGLGHDSSVVAGYNDMVQTRIGFISSTRYRPQSILKNSTGGNSARTTNINDTPVIARVVTGGSLVGPYVMDVGSRHATGVDSRFSSFTTADGDRSEKHVNMSVGANATFTSRFSAPYGLAAICIQQFTEAQHLEIQNHMRTYYGLAQAT